MKRLTLIPITLATCFLLSSSQCKKNKSDADYVYGLPPATQQGKNTLGFLLNGEPWTPKAYRNRANLSIDIDFSYNNGIFSISAYDFSSTVAQQFIIGIRDSLNFLNAPFKLNLNRESLYSVSFNTSCDYFNQLDDVSSSGILNLTKLDKTQKIISGTFNATLSKPGCETIQITQGRFDMKY